MNTSRTLLLLVATAFCIIQAAEEPKQTFLDRLKHGTKKPGLLEKNEVGCLVNDLDKEGAQEKTEKVSDNDVYLLKYNDEKEYYEKHKQLYVVNENIIHDRSTVTVDIGGDQEAITASKLTIKKGTPTGEFTTQHINLERVSVTLGLALSIYCLRDQIAGAYTYTITGISNFFYGTPEEQAAKQSNN